MTAVTSTAKNNFFSKRISNNLQNSKKLITINCVLSLLGLPFMAVLAVISAAVNQHNLNVNLGNIEQLFIVCVIAVCISLFSGILFALDNFKYLYTKTLVDMHYSLPLNSKQRFFADFLTGLACYVIPVIASIILSIAIFAVSDLFLDMKFFWEILGEMLILSTVVIIGMILFYSTAVFAINCCGSTFEAIFSIFAINIIIPVSVFCISAAVTECGAFGLTSESVAYSWIFSSTSVVGNVFFFVSYAEYLLEFYSFVYLGYFRWFVPTAIIITALIVSTYFLYKKRKAESVSKPYVYKFFYYAIVTLAVFCILSTFIIYGGSFLAGVILCAILYLIMEVASKRGFKRFGYSILRYAATVVIVMGFCTLCRSTDGFGAAKYVPRSSAVKSVAIYGDFLFGWHEEIIYEDENVIKAVTNLQKDIVNRYYEPESYKGSIGTKKDSQVSSYDDIYSYEGHEYIKITYALNNGSTSMRYYDVSSDMLDDLLLAILTSDEYANTMADDFTVISANKNGVNARYFNTAEDAAANCLYFNIDLTDKSGFHIDYKTINSTDMKSLINAYRTDFMAMTEEDWKNAEVYGYMNDYVILESFSNTIAELDKLGFVRAEPDITRYDGEIYSGLAVFPEFEAFNNIDNMYDEMKNYSNNRYIYDEYYDYGIERIYSLQGSIATVNNNQYNSADGVKFKDLEYNEELMALLDCATPIVIGELPIGAVCIVSNGGYIEKTLYVPDTQENKELLESVYESQIKGKENIVREEVYYD